MFILWKCYRGNYGLTEKSGIKKLLADKLIEEQNHAEMLKKYITTNSMK